MREAMQVEAIGRKFRLAHNAEKLIEQRLRSPAGRRR
jgi:hypothetical protein